MLREEWRKRTSEPGVVDPPAAALLPDLSVLRFAGSDAETFLQGYLTIDTSRIQDAEPVFAALTSLKGRVVASGWCIRPAAGVLDWVVHASLSERIAGFMRPYLAFSRTSLAPLADDHLVVGRIPPDGPPCVAVITSPADLSRLLAGHAVTTAPAWQAACVAARLALVSGPVSEAFLPQMLGLVEAGAVDFGKGCYLGQEVVARAQHRGAVKRQLIRLQGDPGDVAPGMPLKDPDDHEAGMLISATVLGAELRGLGVVRTPPATAYTCAGSRLQPF